jgi:hypothetical protein
MASRIFRLKEAVIKEIPKGELPYQVLIRLALKTKFPWVAIKEDTEVTPEQFNMALQAAQEVLGKKFFV